MTPEQAADLLALTETLVAHTGVLEAVGRLVADLGATLVILIAAALGAASALPFFR